MRLTLYSRRSCHLCDEMKAVIEAVRRHQSFELEVIDIDGDEALRRRFDLEVPVLFVDGRKAFKFRVDEADLLQRLRRS